MSFRNFISIFCVLSCLTYLAGCNGDNPTNSSPVLTAVNNVDCVNCSNQNEPICRYRKSLSGVSVGIQYPGQVEHDIDWVWQGELGSVDPFLKLKELQDMGVCNQDKSICRYRKSLSGVSVGIQYPGQVEHDIDWVWQGELGSVDPFLKLKELQDMGVCN